MDKVYIAVRQAAYEGGYIQGIFLTKKEADEELAAIGESFWENVVHEVPIGVGKQEIFIG